MEGEITASAVVVNRTAFAPSLAIVLPVGISTGDVPLLLKKTVPVAGTVPTFVVPVAVPVPLVVNVLICV